MKKSILMLALGIGMSTFAFAQNRNTTQGVNRTDQTRSTTDTDYNSSMYNNRDNDWNSDSYIRDMELDEEQRTQFNDLRTRRQNEMNELDQRYNDPLQEYRNERNELDTRYDEEFRGMLNEDQRKRYDTQMEERRNRRSEMNNRDNGMNNRDNNMNNRNNTNRSKTGNMNRTK